MAKFINNSLFKGLTGTFGDFCFRIINGRTHIVKRPRRGSHQSPMQRKTQSRFCNATQYAKRQSNDWEMRRLYQTGVNDKKRSAYHVALTDALNAPEIHYVDITRYNGAKGDVITIKATDDFKVARVRVIITDGQGHRLECGDAVASRHKRNIWKYAAKESNQHLLNTTIKVSAFDLPENETNQEVTVSPPDIKSTRIVPTPNSHCYE